MKKLILTIAAFSLYSFQSYGYAENMENHSVELTEEMLSYLPHKDENLNLSEDPLKFLEAIQLGYHFREYEKAIERTEEFIELAKPIYEQDRNTVVFPKKIPDMSAESLYVALKIFEGMLYHRMAIENIGLNLEANKEEQDQQKKNSINYMKKAEDALTEAVTIDAQSPEAFYQLGKFYSDQIVSGDTNQAEEAFFKAAQLSLEHGNKEGHNHAKAAIQKLNPESSYLEKLK